MAASVLGKNLQNSRVSAVLNRDVKQYGKQFLFDGNDDTCWNSGEGSSQWISLELTQPARLERLVVQFQGGFVAQEAVLEAGDQAEMTEIARVYPEDVNKSQSFAIDHPDPVKRLKLKFTKTTDFFSRIIIYHLDFLGEVS